MTNNGIQLRVGDMIYAIRKRWKLIALLTILGLGFGIILSGVNYLQGSMTKNYVVTGSVTLTSQAESGEFSNKGTTIPGIDDIRMAEEIMESVIYIIRSEKVLNAAINNLELIGITNRDISSNMRVNRYNETLIIEFSLTWRNAEEAIEILNAVLEAAQKEIYALYGMGRLSTVNEPTSRYLVGGSINAPIWGYMLVLGFAGGVGIAILELLMRPTLINLRDVESSFGLETIGVIPRDNVYFRMKRSLLVEDEGNLSEIEQNFSAAAYILRNRLGTRAAHKCFYVTSARAGEGKTTVAANLAIQLSDMEQKVLLMDLNTRNPNIGGLFLESVDYNRSMNALYRGEATAEDCITTLTGYLDILPMVLEHHPIPMDGTVFDLIKSLQERYDYIIMDTAPVGEFSDTLSLNEVASTVLFVIGFDTSTMQEIKESIDKMDKSGIRVLGCVVNGAQTIGEINPAGSPGKQGFDLFSRNSGGFRREPAVRTSEEMLDDQRIDKMEGDLLDGAQRLSRQEKKEKRSGLFARKNKKEAAAPGPESGKTEGAEGPGTATDQEETEASLSPREKRKRARDEARRKRDEARKQRDAGRRARGKNQNPQQADEAPAASVTAEPDQPENAAKDKTEPAAGNPAEKRPSLNAMMESLMYTREDEQQMSNAEMLEALLRYGVENTVDAEGQKTPEEEGMPAQGEKAVQAADVDYHSLFRESDFELPGSSESEAQEEDHPAESLKKETAEQETAGAETSGKEAAGAEAAGKEAAGAETAGVKTPEKSGADPSNEGKADKKETNEKETEETEDTDGGDDTEDEQKTDEWIRQLMEEYLTDK